MASLAAFGRSATEEHMSESRKPAGGKGRRPSKPTGASGKTGYGQSGGKSSGKTGGQSTGKPGGKSGRPSGKPGHSPRNPTDGRGSMARKPHRSGEGFDPRERKKEPRPGRPGTRGESSVDDFDFDDLNLDAGDAPAAFPSPARPVAGRGQDQREDRHRGRMDRDARDDRPARPAREPRSAEEGQRLEEDGKSVTAGKNPVRELLESFPKRVDAVYVRKGQREARAQEIVALADQNRIKVQFVDDVVLRRLYPGSHQGVIAVTAAVEYAELDTLIASVVDAPLPVLLALDKVQDPGNLGAVARTAWALGAAGIIVPRHGGAYIGAGAMRASAGALHHLPVARVTNMSQALDACAEAGLPILCADAEGENLYTATIHLPAVLVLGGEEKGVRFGVAKHCQTKLAIPFRREFDSLNVAQAAAICLARLGQL
jgi:23S rRNA (guanosine2251-2'-O)-methyltransferase